MKKTSISLYVFQVFKCLIYVLLTANIFFFYQEESLAVKSTFSQGISITDIIQGFAATLDTAAWVMLLFLFELNTSEYLKRLNSLNNAFIAKNFIRIFSYGLICYAFFGYLLKYILLINIEPFFIEDVCSLVDQGYYLIENLDEYPLMTASNCLALSNNPLFVLSGQAILGTKSDWQAIQNLGLVDIINSGTWILVVMIIELEVLFGSKLVTTRLKFLNLKILKTILYLILFSAAAFWGFKGDFLDFWDAFLWLVAFFFIELNLLKIGQPQTN